MRWLRSFIAPEPGRRANRLFEHTSLSVVAHSLRTESICRTVEGFRWPLLGTHTPLD
jgi:hypothetical protein